MRPFVVIFSIFVGITSAVDAQSSKTNKSDAPPLTLSVKVDRQSYRLSDRIRVETEVLNTGKSDIYIWKWDLCWNFARGLSMHVVEANGTPVQGDVLFDCVPPPPKEGDIYAFVRLEPGQFYGIVDQIKVTDIVNKPGELKITVTYSGSLSSKIVQELLKHDPIAKLPLWTAEQGAIEAPPVYITVQP